MGSLGRSFAAVLLPCAIVAAVWGADLAWAAQSGLRVAGVGYLALALLLLFINFYFYQSRPAGDRAAALVSGFAIFFALATGTGLMSYLAATLDRPLADPWLARADAAVGFHWLDWYRFVRANHLLHTLLANAYALMIPQVICCLFAFPLSGMIARNRELLALFAVSMVPTLILFALFPAECPWVYFNAQPGYVAVHWVDLQALRAGKFPLLDLQRIHGLVTFPSYHTVTAVLLIYLARGTRFFFLAAVVDGLMLASVPSEGGHYLMDLLAGLVIAGSSILLVRRASSWIEAPATTRV